MAEAMAILTGLPFTRLKSTKTDRSGASAYDQGDYLLAPIREIEEIEYGGLVYDIQVNGSHSFVGNGMILHNTFAEAMATGLPSIYTPATAMLDLAPIEEQVGYPIKFDLKWEDWSWAGTEDDAARSYAIQAQLATPDTYDLALNMGKVMSDWTNALARGRKASRRIRELFTWENCGRKLIEVVESIQ